MIESACTRILNTIEAFKANYVIGFDIEFKTDTSGIDGSGQDPCPRTDNVDQLGLKDKVLVFKVCLLMLEALSSNNFM